MKNHYLILTALIFASCNDQSEDIFNDTEQSTDAIQVNSKYLTFEEAAIEATNALIEFSGNNPSRTSNLCNSADVSIFNGISKSRSSGIDSTFYVVNFKNGGAVLIAADKRIINKVYGISLTGNFQSSPNPNQQEYMDWAYEDARIATNDSSRGILKKPVDSDINKAVLRIINGVVCTGYPLPKEYYNGGTIGIAKWNQLNPYNYFVPNRTIITYPVGCVAVAIGQICSHHKKPEQFKNRNYNWDDMTYSSSPFSIADTGATDIAQFLYDVAVNSHTSFGSNASGATMDNAFLTFYDLGYIADGIKKYSDWYCTSSLDLNRPVFMTGVSENSTGHAWVVEAYKKVVQPYELYRQDNNEYFGLDKDTTLDLYMNWGWGGINDGYYRAPGPYVTGTNIYSKNFKIIHNIRYNE